MVALTLNLLLPAEHGERDGVTESEEPITHDQDGERIDTAGTTDLEKTGADSAEKPGLEK